MDDAAPGLYVRRDLTAASAAAFDAWATAQGFENRTPPHQLHATIVYSRSPVAIQPLTGGISASGGPRTVEPLGDKGAVVLKFQSPVLAARWQQARDAGASWDHPTGYQPHITISYDAYGKDLATVTPYPGVLEFGSEVHEPLNEDWATDQKLRALADDEIADADLTAPVKAKRDHRIEEIAALLLLFLLRSRWYTLVGLGWSAGEDGALVPPAGTAPTQMPAPVNPLVTWPGEVVEIGHPVTLADNATKVLLDRLATITPTADAASILTGVTRQEFDGLVQSAVAQATTLVDQVDATTAKQLDEALTTAREAGQVTAEEAKALVDKVFDEAVGTRTDTAAVTETASTRAQGVAAGTVRAGLKSNEWVTMRDPKVRSAHVAMDGQVRNVGRQFVAPSGDGALYPGGFDIPELDCNCRCILVPHTTSVSAP